MVRIVHKFLQIFSHHRQVSLRPPRKAGGPFPDTNDGKHACANLGKKMSQQKISAGRR